MPPPTPNILWICTDSQRLDSLGCYGNPFVHTPNLDRLAREGMLFEHCYAQNPLCQPSRGAFLTGRYPSTNKLRQNGQDIPEETILVTRLLAEAGYVCGLSGKLHLSACDRRLTYGPEWWKRPEWQWKISGTERRINDGYSVFHWDHAPSPEWIDSSYHQWVKAKGARIQSKPREDCPDVHHGMPEELHQTTFCVEKAIDFIEAHAERPEVPWLFSVNIFDPHYQNNPPDEYLERYLHQLDQIPLPHYQPGELDHKPAHQQDRHKSCHYGRYHEIDAGDPYYHRMNRAAYWAMCDLIDKQVGRLLETLERLGQRENTLIIFTSDHGEMLGDHGLYIKGPFLYDEAIRVPLILSMPGTLPEGVRRNGLVELSDLAPTILDCAGLPRHPGMQMQSLWPWITDGQAPDQFRQEVYCEYHNSNPDKPEVSLTMIRDHHHKIVAWHGNEPGELYDMEKDPHETVNRWDDPAYLEIKCQLLQRLAARMAATVDPLPVRTGVF